MIAKHGFHTFAYKMPCASISTGFLSSPSLSASPASNTTAASCQWSKSSPPSLSKKGEKNSLPLGVCKQLVFKIEKHVGIKVFCDSHNHNISNLLNKIPGGYFGYKRRDEAEHWLQARYFVNCLKKVSSQGGYKCIIRSYFLAESFDSYVASNLNLDLRKVSFTTKPHSLSLNSTSSSNRSSTATTAFHQPFPTLQESWALMLDWVMTTTTQFIVWPLQRIQTRHKKSRHAPRVHYCQSSCR